MSIDWQVIQTIAVTAFSTGSIVGFLSWLSTRKSKARQESSKADKEAVLVKKAEADVEKTNVDSFAKEAKIYQDLNKQLVHELERERAEATRKDEIQRKRNIEVDEKFQKYDKRIKELQDEFDKVHLELKAEKKSKSNYESLWKICNDAMDKCGTGVCGGEINTCPIHVEYRRLLEILKG